MATKWLILISKLANLIKQGKEDQLLKEYPQMNKKKVHL